MGPRTLSEALPEMSCREGRIPGQEDAPGGDEDLNFDAGIGYRQSEATPPGAARKCARKIG